MISNTVKVGKFICEMTLSPHLTAQWCQNIPKRLSRKELHQYYAGRNALLAEFAKAFGFELVTTDDAGVMSDNAPKKRQGGKRSALT